MEYLEKWTLMLAIPLVLGCTACSESAPEYGYVEISEAKGSFDTVSIAISDHEGFIKTSRVVEDFEMLPLKTKGKKLIGRVYQIFITENRIFILDDTQLSFLLLIEQGMSFLGSIALAGGRESMNPFTGFP